MSNESCRGYGVVHIILYKSLKNHWYFFNNIKTYFGLKISNVIFFFRLEFHTQLVHKIL